MKVKLLLGLLVGLGIFAVYLTLRGYPMINDISTDLDTPPEFEAVEGGGRSSAHPGAEVAAKQRATYPDLGPLIVKAPPGQVFPALKAAAEFMGWRIVASDPARGRLQAVAVTRMLRFKDDVVVRVRAEGEGSRVDVRSKSRLGRSDFGANARRIRAYLVQVQAVWSRGW